MVINGSNNIEEILGLSKLQEGIFFHYLNEPKNNLYHEYVQISMLGKIQLELLQKTIDLIVDNNEMLKAKYIWDKIKMPVQVISKKARTEIIYFDLSEFSEKEKDKHILKIKNGDFSKGFDLNYVPLRFYLIKLDEYNHKFVISNHHILFDGWSTGVLLKEIFTNYLNLFDDQAKINPKLRYKDFLLYQKRLDIKSTFPFWKDYLAGFVEKSQIPFSAIVNEPVHLRYTEDFSKENYISLNEFCKKNKVTISDVLYLSWGVLLARYNNINNAVFGIIDSGRELPLKNIENSIGLFINTFPLRTTFRENDTVIEALKRLQAEKNNIIANYSSTPLVEIKECSSLTDKREELFDSLLVIENYPIGNILLSNNELKIIDFNSYETTNYILTLNILLFWDKIEITISHRNSTNIKELKEILHRYKIIIQNLIIGADTKINYLDIIDNVERETYLKTVNRTQQEYKFSPSIADLFEDQAIINPDKVALVFKNQTFTYCYLNYKAEQLANLIINEGIDDEAIVSVLIERSSYAIYAFLGILKVGAAFLPIDPGYPIERIKYMLKSSKTKIILVTKNSLRYFNQKELSDKKIIVIDQIEDKNILIESKKRIRRNSNQLAYLIYTSGSTGNPKGIAIENKNVLNFHKGISSFINLNPSKSVLGITTFCFDIFILEIIVPLMQSLKVILCSDEEQKSIEDIKSLVEKHLVNIVQFTPSRLRLYKEIDNSFSSLKNVTDLMIGGEAFPNDLYSTLKNLNCNIFNMYGPTETTIWSTIKLIKSKDITLGKPISNTSIYVLNPKLKIQPCGFPGELYIGGHGLARCYWNNEQLTKEKFIINPYTQCRIYKTGDIVQINDDGEPQFIGRKDNQVKIRGYRIELSEIEKVISEHPLIKLCIVNTFENIDKEHIICAYYISATEIDSAELRQYVKDKLPEYMVPQYFKFIVEVPYTPNGKIDKKRLPAPEFKTQNHQKITSNDIIENRLITIWADILKIDPKSIGKDTSFFILGGHSLKATLLSLRIKKQFEINISLKDLFSHPSINVQADLIRLKQVERFRPLEKTKAKDYYFASSAQKRLFLLQQINPNSIAYNMTQGIRVKGDIQINTLEKIFNELIERHESLRTSFSFKDDEVIQTIQKEKRITPKYFECNSCEIESTIKKFVHPFNLSDAPLLRIGLIKTLNVLDYNYIILIDIHHIIADEASHKVLKDDFAKLLASKAPKEIKYTYKDFSEWLNDIYIDGLFGKLQNYWLKRYSDYISELKLTNMLFQNKNEPINSGEILNFELSQKQYDKLLTMTNETNTTLYMVLLTVYYVLLHKYSNQEDIVVTSPVSTRPHADLLDIVGIFVNMLPLRNYPRGEISLVDFLVEVKENTLNDFDNQLYQFENIILDLNIIEKFKRNTFIDAVFVLRNKQDNEQKRLEDKDGNYIEIDTHPIVKNHLHNLLQIDAIEDDNRISFELAYSKRYYTIDFAEEFIKNYLVILDILLLNRNLKIKDIQIDKFEYLKKSIQNHSDLKDFRF